MHSYDTLIEIADVDNLSNEAMLENIGLLIDAAHDLGKLEGTNRALEWADALEARGPSAALTAELDYFRANAWADLRAARHADRTASWSWEQPELQREIFCLRKALNSPAFEGLHPIRRCEIFTNLGNQLNTVGRFVDALEYWARAISLMPDFWMAQGNRGCGRLSYARALYDTGHRNAFVVFAQEDLTAASVADPARNHLGSTAARAQFAAELKALPSAADVQEWMTSVQLDGYPMGDSAQEREYRSWCLHRRLFLNPLNDLGAHSIAARDILTLPSFVTDLDEPPVLIGFFNQMKQEFVSARWFYYEATSGAEPHFSDRGVLLHNTLDYPAYSLAVEKLRAAYRVAYSLFDKAAYFLNEYLKLGIPQKAVSFSAVWKEKGVIRPQFESSENWPFRGLYWLSKDLFDKDGKDLIEPDARALHEVRNHLEHKYLKVHDMLLDPPPSQNPASSLFVDTLAYSIRRTDLEEKTLRLLKLARAALIYLSLGMHREEQRRAGGRPEGLIAPMVLDTWEDDWKW